MPTSPKYPVYWDTWGTCGTCGFAIPSAYLVMTRKHGWQCLPGSGRSRGCWDGNYDRDDIYFVYPDDEGSRNTAAPLADQGKPYFQIYVYVFVDSVTGLLYSADFAAATLTLTLITEVDEETMFGPFDWLEANNGWRLYVANGIFRTGLFSTVYCPSAPGADQTIPTFAPAPTNVIVEPPGDIIYTPPGGSPVPPFPPPDELQLLVDERWENLFVSMNTVVVDERWENLFQSVTTTRVDERWES